MFFRVRTQFVPSPNTTAVSQSFQVWASREDTDMPWNMGGAFLVSSGLTRRGALLAAASQAAELADRLLSASRQA